MGDGYQYRVVVAKNQKLYRVLKEYKGLKNAKNKFKKLKEEKQVLFPKKFTNYKKIGGADYELLLLKKKDSDGTTFRRVYNDSGKLITEKAIGDWVIINRTSYCAEETFHVYGCSKRLNVAELLKDVFVPRFTGFYQVLMVLNKIVIVNGSDIEVILTKNLTDCKRLYDYLFDFIRLQGFYNLLFLGTANKQTRSSLYDQIQLHTGLTRKELYRTSTRS